MHLIRKAQAEDAARIEALYRQLVSNPAVSVKAERIAALADAPHTALFVYERDGSVLGSALLSLCADVMFDSQPFAVVENVVVDEGARGRGIGSALLRHIEAFCLEKDCSKIMLLSARQREEAHQFFEQAGFNGASKRGFVKYRRHFDTGLPSN